MSFASAIKVAIRKQILPHPPMNTRPSLTNEPVVIAGMFQTLNGIGKAAQMCYECLESEGFAPLATDTSAFLNQVQLPSPVPLSRLEPANPGTLVLFANPPEVERCLMGLGLRRWHSWRIVGAWAWETSIAPREWQRQSAFVSEIWAPSEFVSDAFRKAYDKPVKTVPHAVRQSAVPETSGTNRDSLGQLADSPVHILMIADARSSLDRKNPLAAVEMFRLAFPETGQARLTLKCRSLSLYPAYASRLEAAIGGDRRITLIDQTLSDAELAHLLATADILLAPHRSEGFGLHLAEAMAAGKCVVATGWSGNLEFMNEENAALLPYRLIPVADPTGVYSPQPDAVWADPDIEAGARMLAALVADPARRAQLGAAAQRTIGEGLSASVYRLALAQA